MYELLLHAGHEHPNTAYIALASVFSFVAGIVVGRYAPSREALFGTVGDRAEE